ncbi:hypothetical protein EPR50_G00187250 [Perca flavescens]|uniref:Uncharacterized protein n=1 Tax=Perca flavescens TaxID=8167 RepID=A0A484C9Z3_PERFV|nr:hypothetical protein EPR50_G00187250 [Perca flavescens]
MPTLLQEPLLGFSSPSPHHPPVPGLNRISEINSTSLSALEDLQELDLGGQHVRLVIRNNAFSGQRLLRKLVLDITD